MGKDKNGQCCACCTYGVKITVFTVIGIILVVTGGVLIPVFKNVIRKTIKEVSYIQILLCLKTNDKRIAFDCPFPLSLTKLVNISSEEVVDICRTF